MSERANVNMLICVAFDEDKGNYFVDLGKGSSIPETAFGVCIIIKCLLKDGYIKDKAEFLDLVNKYLDDPQYEEITDDTQEVETVEAIRTEDNELKENDDGGNNVQ